MPLPAFIKPLDKIEFMLPYLGRKKVDPREHLLISVSYMDAPGTDFGMYTMFNMNSSEVGNSDDQVEVDWRDRSTDALNSMIVRTEEASATIDFMLGGDTTNITLPLEVSVANQLKAFIADDNFWKAITELKYDMSYIITPNSAWKTIGRDPRLLTGFQKRRQSPSAGPSGPAGPWRGKKRRAGTADDADADAGDDMMS